MKKIKLIAETAWHHESNYLFMKALVNDVLNNARLDILKLHISLNYKEYSHSSLPDYDLLGGNLFSTEQWTTLIKQVQTNNNDASENFKPII